MHAAVSERAVKSLVAHIAEAIDGHVRGAFAEKHGRHGDVVDLAGLAKVVDHAGDAQQIERAQPIVLDQDQRKKIQGKKGAHAGGIVVVAVDAKARDGHVEVGVLVVDVAECVGEKVDGGIAEKLEGAGAIAKAVAAEELHRVVEGAARGFVFVEEVAAEKDHVDLVLDAELKNLFE